MNPADLRTSEADLTEISGPGTDRCAAGGPGDAEATRGDRSGTGTRSGRRKRREASGTRGSQPDLAAPQGGAPRPSAAARVPTSLRHAGAARPQSPHDEPEPRGGRPRGASRSGAAARGTAAGRGGRSPPAGGGAGRRRGAAPTFPVGSRLPAAARRRTALSAGDDGRPAGSRLLGGGLLLSEGERRAEPRGSGGLRSCRRRPDLIPPTPGPGSRAPPHKEPGSAWRLFCLSVPFALRLLALSRVIAACTCRKLTRARRRS